MLCAHRGQHTDEARDVGVVDVAEHAAYHDQISRDGTYVVGNASCIATYGLDAVKSLAPRDRRRSLDEARFQLDQPPDDLLPLPPAAQHRKDVSAVSRADAEHPQLLTGVRSNRIIQQSLYDATPLG